MPVDSRQRHNVLLNRLNINAGYDGDIYYTIVLNGGIHFVMYVGRKL